MSALTALVSALAALVALGISAGQLTPTGRSIRRLESLNKLIETGPDNVKTELKTGALQEAKRLTALLEAPASPWPAVFVFLAATLAFAALTSYAYTLEDDGNLSWPQEVAFDAKTAVLYITALLLTSTLAVLTNALLRSDKKFLS